MKQGGKSALYALIVILLFGLRLVNLTSDPPPWLSWSSGIYTDEGIYAADARSAVLFGQWAPGDFHSAEIAPLHHLLLLGLFHILGVSLLSMRLLGAASSLITLGLFYLTLRKEFDERVAAVGTIFLGFSPVFVFYNRLALLETPTVLLLVAALYGKSYPKLSWLTGIFLALAVIYKPLAILCVPAFFVDCRDTPSVAVQRLGWMLSGLAVFFFAWQLPHRTDLSRLNHYYLLHQYLPHSIVGLGHNLVRSLWSGSSDGVLPYLLHHAALLVALVLLAALYKREHHNRDISAYTTWLVVPFCALCCLSYEPSRYFILFWPALCAVAAIGVVRLTPALSVAVAVAYGILSVFAIISSLQVSTHTLLTCGRELGRSLPAEQLIVGQYAPELALSNHLPSIYVQPGLANSKGRLSGAVILITESPYWSSYWLTREGSRLKETDLPAFDLPHRQHISLWHVDPQPNIGTYAVGKI